MITLYLCVRERENGKNHCTSSVKICGRLDTGESTEALLGDPDLLYYKKPQKAALLT